MSDLDKKLRALLTDSGLEDEPGVTIDDYVKLIKQAFADAGYMEPDSYRIPPYYFTGQEFYDRFKKELNKLFNEPEIDYAIDNSTSTDGLTISTFLVLAKRAAGLPND